MFSYQQVSRWLPFTLDPVTIEDWIANRELFGASQDKNISEEEKALELGYLTELVREKKSDILTKDLPIQVLLDGMEVAGLVEVEDTIIVAPMGKPHVRKAALEVQFDDGSGSQKKIEVQSFDLLVVKTDPAVNIKVKIKCKDGLKLGDKSDVLWSGSGKANLVFDTRGRPIPAMTMEQSREFALKVKQQLS